MAGAAVICTLLTPMSATFVSSYTKKTKVLVLKVVLHFWPSPKRCVCVAVEDEEALKTKTELSFQLLCGRAKHHASPLSCVHVQL